MNGIVLQALRILRWLSWLAFVVFCVYVYNFREGFFNSFGHLLPNTELVMFGLPILAMAIGLTEMAMRQRIARRLNSSPD